MKARVKRLEMHTGGEVSIDMERGYLTPDKIEIEYRPGYLFEIRFIENTDIVRKVTVRIFPEALDEFVEKVWEASGRSIPLTGKR